MKTKLLLLGLISVGFLGISEAQTCGNVYAGGTDIYLANSSFYNASYTNSPRIRFWVSGYWTYHRHGRRTFVPGHYEYREESIPCVSHEVVVIRNDYDGYNGMIGCHDPVMNDYEFDDLVDAIRRRDFESSKLSVAEQGISRQAVYAKQVRKIMRQFDFESTRLEFAKFAYSRTIDTERYYLVNDAFDFESSVYELNRFIGRR